MRGARRTDVANLAFPPTASTAACDNERASRLQQLTDLLLGLVFIDAADLCAWRPLAQATHHAGRAACRLPHAFRSAPERFADAPFPSARGPRRPH